MTRVARDASSKTRGRPSRASGSAATRHEPPIDLHTSAWRRALAKRLEQWYRKAARDLPWRRTRDPYAIWVSEVMLQQTQVATVVGYFERFLTAWPTIADLAQADERDVLRAWEGLGYYSRARQLHAAARLIVERHAGRFPRNPDEVRALPGVGRYTAGAVLSLAFDQRQPIVEANTLRLFSRMAGFRGDPRSPRGAELLWQAAEAWLPEKGAGQFNQAAMELGSQVCLPRQPRCEVCPVASLCRARQLKLVDQIPLPKPPPKVETRHEVAVAIRKGNQLLLRRYTRRGRWQGLWDFPRFPLIANRGGAAPTRNGAELQKTLQDAVFELTGVRCQPGEKVATLHHSVTRFRIRLDCYLAIATTRPKARPDIAWVSPDSLEAYPLPITARRLARRLLATSKAAAPVNLNWPAPTVRRTRSNPRNRAGRRRYDADRH